MELSGAMLDLAIQTSQPRTAPVRMIKEFYYSAYGREHVERAVQLRPAYLRVLRCVPPSQRERLNASPLNLKSEMERAYLRHLRVALLCAAGLKTDVAERVRLEQIHALRTNIAILKHKQEEFNQRIDVYTGEIEKLVASLASLPKTQVESPPAPSLVVRCVGCGREREFPGFAVLRTFAPKDDFHGPTELWLDTEAGPRRGVFRCPECGPSTLAIKTRG